MRRERLSRRAALGRASGDRPGAAWVIESKHDPGGGQISPHSYASTLSAWSERRAMPIRKYRSVAEMPGVRPLRPLDPDNLRIACELTELSFALHPWRFEPGVRKFRSLEEANRHREEWEKNQVRSPH